MLKPEQITAITSVGIIVAGIVSMAGVCWIGTVQYEKVMTAQTYCARATFPNNYCLALAKCKGEQ